MADQITHFGTRADGRTVEAITLRDGPLSATVLTHGAVLQSLYLDGHAHSLTLGSPDIAAYEGAMSYFGAIVAPVVNRIAGAEAMIDGQIHRFQANTGRNTLHSGDAGSQHAIWTLADHGAAHATLTLTQPDGAGGFPGTRHITATYALNDATLSLEVTATTDAPTLMNVAHHGYWNLDGTPTWAGHSLHIAADHILTTDAENIPTGAPTDLAGHPFDFREPRAIVPGGLPHLDHNFCLAPARRPLAGVLTLTGRNGIAMHVASTEPGVQIFDGEPIDTGTLPTVHDRSYGAHCGLAIEPQCWPDAPHHPDYPDIGLHPDDTYRQTTTFRFAQS